MCKFKIPGSSKRASPNGEVYSAIRDKSFLGNIAVAAFQPEDRELQPLKLCEHFLTSEAPSADLTSAHVCSSQTNERSMELIKLSGCNRMNR